MKRVAGWLLIAMALTSSAAASELKPSDLVGATPRQGLASESIYFVMTDRYANADRSNDMGGEGSQGGFNPASDGHFHGGDFKGLTQNIDRIKRMGFTAIWITPPFVQNSVQGNSAAYHGYWGIDFTTIDPHLGTEADFAAFVDAAHSRGIKVILDIVMNHTGDIIRYKDGNDFVPSGQTKQAYVPEGSPVKKPEWLNDLNNYTNRGDATSCGWSGEDCLINGDFFGLDDINTAKDEVVQGWIDVYGSWVKKYKIDGFRIDTAKHLDPAFLPKFTAGIKQAAAEAGIKDFTMFGEFYDNNPDVLSRYLRDSALPSVLDFAGRDAVIDFAARPNSASSLSEWLGVDDLYNLGNESNAYSLVTFGGNHDMGRLAYGLTSKEVLGGRELLNRVKLAHSILFLSRGAPVVFYGDEVGMMGVGGDRSARQDMFPTLVSSWQTEERVGTKPIGKATSLSTAAEKHPIATHIRSLNALRKAHPTLARGSMTVRYAKNSVVAWSKLLPTERREYVVLANSQNQAVTVTVNTSTPSSRFAALFGTKVALKSDAKGALKVTIPASSTVVFRADKSLSPGTEAPTVTLSLTNGMLTAKLASTRDLPSITFTGRDCSTCEWKALGTDDAAPFRFMLTDKSIKEVVAVIRTSDGKVRESLPLAVN